MTLWSTQSERDREALAAAERQVKEIAHYQTPSSGGQGAARDAVEYILSAKGILERVVEAYIHARTSIGNPEREA